MAKDCLQIVAINAWTIVPALNRPAMRKEPSTARATILACFAGVAKIGGCVDCTTPARIFSYLLERVGHDGHTCSRRGVSGDPEDIKWLNAAIGHHRASLNRTIANGLQMRVTSEQAFKHRVQISN